MAKKGEKMSEETKAKIAAAHRGKTCIGHPQTPETRAKISAAQKGKPRPDLKGNTHTKGKKLNISDERRAQIKATLHSPESKAKSVASRIGKPLSEEHKAKLSAKRKGRKLSDEQVAKMKGRKRPEETVAKMREGMKKSWANATPERRARASEASKGNTNAKGHKLTDEQKKHLSQANAGKQSTKGMTRTPEQRAKMSEIKKQHWANATEEQRERVRSQLSLTSGYWTGKKRPEIGAVISAKNKGKVPPNKGIPATPEQRAKSSEAHKQQWANATPEQREQMLTPWINASKDKKNTTIEQFIATKFDLQGITYERERRIGNYYVDFYIESKNKVIECNGCYWHGCEECGYNTSEHIDKRAKDAKRYERLRTKGYVVEVLWEHDLRKEMKDTGWTA